MQPATKLKPEPTAIIVDFKTRKIAQQKISSKQNEDKEKHCFQSDHRYYCKDYSCGCWDECQKLVAAWLR
jgi:hypothetical protein